jgi:two-component sensor histidine kinase
MPELVAPEQLIGALEPSQREYLRQLSRRWGFLSDLCFSDLLVYLPIPSEDAFIVAGQVRPATAQTVHPGDLVGRRYDATEVPAVSSSYRSGGFAFSEWVDPASSHMVVSHAIPLRVGGSPFGVLARDYMLNPQRIQGELESTYLMIFERFARMILEGEYPYQSDESGGVPRVGDGVVLLDADFGVTFFSPNAVSAIHRLGCQSPSLGRPFDEQGIFIEGPRRAAESHLPVLEEVEGPQDSAVTFYCMPLLERGRPEGYLLLLQDVTNLRRSERLLLSKDATIREVHHRVKNNLQTISSLLRLQGRRVDSEVARNALLEAERRIRSIAVVHEVLSREIGEQVPISEVADAIVMLARESAPPGVLADIAIIGDLGALDASLATPLAVVMQELLLNAIEHAFEGRSGPGPHHLEVTVSFATSANEALVEISDNGDGFPPDFDLERSRSLGLLIVRDLVRSQLRGTIEISRGRPTKISIVIPIPSEESRW